MAVENKPPVKLYELVEEPIPGTKLYHVKNGPSNLLIDMNNSGKALNRVDTSRMIPTSDDPLAHRPTHEEVEAILRRMDMGR